MTLLDRWLDAMRRSVDRSIGAEVSWGALDTTTTLDPLGLLGHLSDLQFHLTAGSGWLPRKDVVDILAALGFFDPDRLALTLVEANDAGVSWGEMAQMVEQWPRRAA